MSRLRWEQIGQLQTLVKAGKDDGPALVLLHGYGADAQDLSGLTPFLDFEENFSFYFPDGPLEIPIGFGQVGKAWFPIPMSQLTDGFDFEDVKPVGLEGIVAKLEKFLSQLPHEEVIIGGFSQGAMLTTHVALMNPSRFRGLVALSGTLCNVQEWQSFCDRTENRFPVFQTHGHYDSILTFHQAQKLDSFFRRNNFETQFYAFNGEHEIPAEAIRRLKIFLSQVSKR